MELIILGSGTAALQADRGPSGYILNISDELCLLDGGTGSLLKCQKLGISYQSISKIFYTHLHPDHTIDLIPFLFATKHTPGFTRKQPLDIYGPKGFRYFLYGLLAVYGLNLLEGSFSLNVYELQETNKSLAPFNLKTRFMQHSENAIGYRFQRGDKVFVYSGDTDYCDGIIDLAHGADVLLLECSFPDENKVSGHLTPSEAATVASKANAKKLVLTHIYPPFDEEQILQTVGASYTGEAIIAKDFMRLFV